MRIRINTKKPLNVLEAKKEADRFNNLAKSAETNLSILLDEIKKVEKKLSALKSQEEEIEKSIREKKEEKNKTSDESLTAKTELKKIQTQIQTDKHVLEKGKKELEILKQSKIEYTDELNQSILVSQKKEQKKLDTILVSIKEQKKILDLNEKDLLVIKNKIKTEKESVQVAEGKNLILQTEKTILEDEIETKKSKLKEVLNELEDLDPAVSYLLDVRIKINTALETLSGLDTKIFERKGEYAEFEEKENLKKENLKKIEEAIDTKARRLKSMLEEKALSKYLEAYNIT